MVKQYFSSGTNDKKAYLYFGHSETINPMLAVLGLYNDTRPLVAADWPALAASHPWQSSAMLGFSHNLALVALQCEDTHQPMVAVYHQVTIHGSDV